MSVQGAITKEPEVGALDGFMGAIGGVLSPLSTGLGIAGQLFGQDSGGPDIAKAGGPFYSGSFSVSKNESSTIGILVVLGVIGLVLLTRGKK